MGLNIGIRVKKQDDGWGNFGHNPLNGIGSIEEVEKSFMRFLELKFPKGGFCGGWVSLSKWSEDKEWYDFDVRMHKYGGEFKNNGYEMEQMWLAITEFIYSSFSHEHGIEMETYWSG